LVAACAFAWRVRKQKGKFYPAPMQRMLWLRVLLQNFIVSGKMVVRPCDAATAASLRWCSFLGTMQRLVPKPPPDAEPVIAESIAKIRCGCRNIVAVGGINGVCGVCGVCCCN
jgi:hypothetical protein